MCQMMQGKSLIMMSSISVSISLFRASKREARVHGIKARGAWHASMLVGSLVFASAFVFALMMCRPCHADGSQTQTSSITLQGDVERGVLPFHKDMFGKACLSYEAVSRILPTNTDVYQHVVSVNNHCHEAIRITLCYWHTDHCQKLLIPASRRKVVVLGVRPFMKRFRYEAREIFSNVN